MEDPKDFVALISRVAMLHAIYSKMGSQDKAVDDPTYKALHALEWEGVDVETKLQEVSEAALLYYQAFKVRQLEAPHEEPEEISILQHIPGEHLAEPEAAPWENLQEVLIGSEVFVRQLKHQFGDLSQFNSHTLARDLLFSLHARYHADWMKRFDKKNPDYRLTR